MSVARLVPGTVFAGDFRVLRPLKEGGMGAVYVALQLSTGKERALKIMQVGLSSDPRFRERFAQEARVGSRVDSEHVVEVVGAGVDVEAGLPWLAMELLRGDELGDYVARRGRLAPGELLEVFEQLGHALSAAHRAGIVHRDLKPENVFLSAPRRSGVPFTAKILDFGIAKLVDDASSVAATQTIGSPLWMAPEQAQRGQAVSPATDVWALGLIAFHALTGRSYWKSAHASGSTPIQVVTEMMFEPIVPASQRALELGVPGAIPPGFDAWLARALERDPGRRFPDAGVAIAELGRALRGAGAIASSPSASSASGASAPQHVLPTAPHAPTVASSSGPSPVAHTLPTPTTAPPRPSRAPLFAVLGALALVATVIGGAALMFSGSRKKPRRDRDEASVASPSSASARDRAALSVELLEGVAAIVRKHPNDCDRAAAAIEVYKASRPADFDLVHDVQLDDAELAPWKSRVDPAMKIILEATVDCRDNEAFKRAMK